jgi:hypothetical protein
MQLITLMFRYFVYLLSYTLFSWEIFRKSFETAKFYSQIPYSFIKLINFEGDLLDKGLYLKFNLILPNNFDTEKNFGRFPITEFLNYIILTLRSKVMVDWKLLLSLQITHEFITRANNSDTLLQDQYAMR